MNWIWGTNHMDRNPRIAFLDTNVLYGGLDNDMFLTLAEPPETVYQPKWSDYVMGELETHLKERAGEEDGVHVKRRLHSMARAFPKANVDDTLIPGRITASYVSDPDDERILAGAVAAGAGFLVTNNVKDFHMREISGDFGIRVTTADEFLTMLFLEERPLFLSAMRRMLNSHRRPPRTFEELHASLNRRGRMPMLASNLRLHFTERYESNRRRQTRTGVQPRDFKGRFTFKPAIDDDLEPYMDDIWGRDGNGYM